MLFAIIVADVFPGRMNDIARMSNFCSSKTTIKPAVNGVFKETDIQDTEDSTRNHDNTILGLGMQEDNTLSRPKNAKQAMRKEFPVYIT